MPTQQRITVVRGFFLLASALILFLFWKIISPYALTLITAGIAAMLLVPIDARIREKIRSPRISALLLITLVAIIVVVPLFIVAVIIVRQATDIVQASLAEGSWLRTFQPEDVPFYSLLPDSVQDQIRNIDLVEVGKQAAQWVLGNVGQIFSSAVEVVFKTFIFLVALYYMLVDRDRIYKNFMDLSPFKNTTDGQIVARISSTVKGVVFGALIVALTQGVMAAIGMTIFGVPGAVLWGAVAVVAAQIPLVGVGLVMVPAIAYLVITGSTAAAIGLAIWAVVVVGLIDNLLSPYLIEGRTQMHALLILISILGGLQMFGTIGFIIGPTILAAVMIIFDLYKSGILEKRKEA